MLFSLFLQDAPADTVSFMIMGFVVIFGVMGLYLVSLIVRHRNLEQDLAVLEEVSAEG